MIKKNILEWTVFFIGIAVILFLILYLSVKIIQYQPTSAELQVILVHKPGRNNQDRYLIILKNKGAETAEDVKVEVAFENGDGQKEKNEVIFPYAPKNSTREAFVFIKTPHPLKGMEIKVVSYIKP